MVPEAIRQGGEMSGKFASSLEQGTQKGGEPPMRPDQLREHSIFFCRLEQEHTRYAERASALFVTKQSFEGQRRVECQAKVNGGKCFVVLVCNGTQIVCRERTQGHGEFVIMKRGATMVVRRRVRGRTRML